jgi:uncharacterized protein
MAHIARAEEVEIGARETEVGFYEGDGLELKEILRERVLLALPMQRVCRQDCKGICPVVRPEPQSARLRLPAEAGGRPLGGPEAVLKPAAS